ncbi:uncharacterized protein J4E87_003175 [Alternaria ethzedia]|uniref:uncharacterized protein n=1 Tax=Alternaria ethzedia TaxID=181014 RepID=UPI0020C51746|nr:uncharacterized protein J4E87_003175 [Alternaria ethzedia]KAI4629988.1 hypothetical protein J4E87_003175 [Alternaria ethzedia]
MADENSTSPKPFRVIVIGAGIVGLSLSHALQLANIEHVVLEKHDKIVSLKGAALIIWPAVARIFDQFGILDRITKTTSPVDASYKRWPDGSLICRDDTMQAVSKLFKIPSILFDRQTCVSHLYEGLPDKSKIHTSRRLERIEQTDTGVRVHLADGSTEEGDMVIGADGVHSHVRKLMWDHADKFEPGSIPETDKEVMSFGEYRGLFGVSTVPDNAQLGTSNTNMILGQDVTMLLFSQMGRAMWGITFKDEFQKAEQKGKATEAEIEAVAERFADLPMTKSITLGDVWKTNERHGLLYVEEGVLSKWHAGRIVLMTADLGMGANIAVESAVHLCNILHREFASNPTRRISTPDLAALFAEYQAGRHARAKEYVETSGKLTRMNSYQSRFNYFFAGYLHKYIVPSQKAGLIESLSVAPKLDYAPTRTIDESAEGWHWMEKQEMQKAKKGGWFKYMVLTSVVGVTAAYMARAGVPALLMKLTV